MKNYNVSFVVKENWSSGFCGFSIHDDFDPGYDLPTLWHDIFEHFFENTSLFKTAELSQAGECVAMGIRSWFDDNSGLVHEFASFNKYNGVEWNSWSVVVGQVGETLEYGSQYPNDFNYSHHPDWNGENTFKGYAKDYDKYYGLKKKWRKRIEKAVSYGYWLGEYMFADRLETIRKFMLELQKWHEEMEFPTDNLDLQYEYATLEVEVGDTITAKFKHYDSEIIISSEVERHYSVEELYEIAY